MGLDISSKSDRDYHYSYSAIHRVRHMAYRSIGGQLEFAEWHNQQGEGGAEYDKTLERFPNLCWHSDCDGKYTRRGKIESFETPGKLQTGNSVKLLEELQFVKDNLHEKDESVINSIDWRIFNDFYELVKDVVENHDGVIEFC